MMSKQENTAKWKVKSSTYIVQDKWISLRADTCETPDGKVISPWYVLEYPEWVNCLVIDSEDTVVLLRHYRYGVDTEVLELISGIADENDESTIDIIQRELHEEIGLEGSVISKTGTVYANPSNQNNRVHTFLALGGTSKGRQYDEAGADFSIARVPFADFCELIMGNDSSNVFQGLHIASVFYGINYIKHASDPSEQMQRLRQQLSELSY